MSKLDAVTAARQQLKDATLVGRIALEQAIHAALAEGHSVAKVARAAGVSRNTIYEWQKQK
jgi:transposase